MIQNCLFFLSVTGFIYSMFNLIYFFIYLTVSRYLFILFDLFDLIVWSSFHLHFLLIKTINFSLWKKNKRENKKKFIKSKKKNVIRRLFWKTRKLKKSFFCFLSLTRRESWKLKKKLTYFLRQRASLLDLN